MSSNPTTFTYSDVSRDPAASARSKVSESTRAELERLGCTRLGWVAARLQDIVLISEIWTSKDGSAVIDVVNHKGVEVVNPLTLLEDGHVVSTERMPGKTRDFVIAHGVRKSAASGYLWHGSHERDLEALFREHRARVESVAARTGSRVVTPADMSVHLAARLRYQALSTEAHALQARVATWCFRASVLVAIALLYLTWRLYRVDAFWSVLSLNAAFLVLPASFFGGYLFLGPSLARLRRQRLVPADVLLEDAKRIGFADLPEEVPELVLPPDAPTLGADAALALERRDARIFAIERASPMLLMGVLGVALGASGVIAVAGLDLASNGLIALRHRRRRLSFLRGRWVGDLVKSEPIALGAACPLVTPVMAWVQLVAGALLVAGAVWLGVTRPLLPIPGWFLPMALAAGALQGYLAASQARKRHAERRKLLGQG